MSGAPLLLQSGEPGRDVGRVAIHRCSVTTSLPILSHRRTDGVVVRHDRKRSTPSLLITDLDGRSTC